MTTAFPHWRKSRRSAPNGDCVEVATLDGTVGVRDSKANGTSPILEFSQAEWASFIEAIRRDVGTR